VWIFTDVLAEHQTLNARRRNDNRPARFVTPTLAVERTALPAFDWRAAKARVLVLRDAALAAMSDAVAMLEKLRIDSIAEIESAASSTPLLSQPEPVAA
jgi:hypothetical protein